MPPLHYYFDLLPLFHDYFDADIAIFIAAIFIFT